MSNPPIVCPGHTRAIRDLRYSQQTPDGIFLISGTHGASTLVSNGVIICCHRCRAYVAECGNRRLDRHFQGAQGQCDYRLVFKFFVLTFDTPGCCVERHHQPRRDERSHRCGGWHTVSTHSSTRTPNTEQRVLTGFSQAILGRTHWR